MTEIGAVASVAAADRCGTGCTDCGAVSQYTNGPSGTTGTGGEVFTGSGAGCTPVVLLWLGSAVPVAGPWSSVHTIDGE